MLYTPAILGLAPYSPYARRRRLLDHVLEVLETYREHLPLTVRQIYYRLVATHDEYPKEQKFYRTVVETLARARRGGLIAWDAIRDDGVVRDRCGTGFADLRAFGKWLRGLAASYSMSKSIGQPRQIFLLCEASGMVPQLVQACGDYPVTVQSAGGMDGTTPKYDLARDCMSRDTVVFHVGDYDPTGLSIFHQIALDVPAIMRDLCEREGVDPPTYECRRIAVLEHHVSEHGLLTGSVKASDDAKDWYPGIAGDRSLTCEAEALPPDVLIGMVRAAIESEIDQAAFAAAEAKEWSDRRRAFIAVKALQFDAEGGEA